MVEGDGWVNNQAYGYKSISKRLREDFSEIAIKLGYAITEYKDTVNASKVQIYPTINSPPQSTTYCGRVYCVSVPNDTILVRRNGRIIWSKNSYALSYKPQKIIESLEGGTKPELLTIHHFHKAEYLFYRNVHAFQGATLERQTPFMKNNGLAAHCGYWKIRMKVNPKGITEITPTYFPFY
jgi:hypothetical protein